MALSFGEIDFGSPEFDAAIDLRYRVLRQPLGLDFSEAELEAEYPHINLAAWENDDLVGILQMVALPEGVWKMRQVAVEPLQQGKKIGAQLVQYSEVWVKNRGAQKIELNARATVVVFYEKLAYQAVGDPFEEVGMPHRKMEKAL